MNLRSGTTKLQTICKPGSEWNNNDLKYYNIRVHQETDYNIFFGKQMHDNLYNDDVSIFLSYDLSSVTFQQNIDWASIRPKSVMTVIKDMMAVTKTHRYEESAVDDLAKSVLQLFDYDDGDRSIRTREILDLDMANGKTQAIPDVCVETMELSIKLLVQEDKSYNVGNDRHLMGSNPEAQLIAEAVAAFQENTKIYCRLGKLDVPKYQLFPGIVMLGTCPTFYLIPVDEKLANYIRFGTKPETETVVKKFVIPDLPINISDVMLSQKHARVICCCYQSFKKYV